MAAVDGSRETSGHNRGLQKHRPASKIVGFSVCFCTNSLDQRHNLLARGACLVCHNQILLHFTFSGIYMPPISWSKFSFWNPHRNDPHVLHLHVLTFSAVKFQTCKIRRSWTDEEVQKSCSFSAFVAMPNGTILFYREGYTARSGLLGSGSTHFSLNCILNFREIQFKMLGIDYAILLVW